MNANPRDHPDYQNLSSKLRDLPSFNQRFIVFREKLYAVATVTLPIGHRDCSFNLDPNDQQLNACLTQPLDTPFFAQVSDVQELWTSMLDNDANPFVLTLGD
jgi:hypothetical protein